jgi:hypothetical protein
MLGFPLQKKARIQKAHALHDHLCGCTHGRDDQGFYLDSKNSRKKKLIHLKIYQFLKTSFLKTEDIQNRALCNAPLTESQLVELPSKPNHRTCRPWHVVLHDSVCSGERVCMRSAWRATWSIYVRLSPLKRASLISITRPKTTSTSWVDGVLPQVHA